MTYVCMWYREDPAYYRNESCEDHSSEYTDHHMGPGRTAEDEKHLGEILQYWWMSDDGDDNHDNDDGDDNHDNDDGDDNHDDDDGDDNHDGDDGL